MTAAAAAASYPVVIEVEPDMGERNRLTVAFRIILAIPHLILVGGPGALAVSVPFSWLGGNGPYFSFGGNGVIGAVAFVCAFISWFAILFASKHPRGLWDLGAFYMRWWARSAAYVALLRDEYPPFGESGDYPARFATEFPDDATRDKLSVGLRIFYLIPHAIVLFFLGIAWFVVSVIAWFAILFNGKYPASLVDFSVGVFRWQGRVAAYALLMRDEYPPFSLQA
jgi:hypothetical protein